MMTILFWVVTIILALGFAGSIIQLVKEGFNAGDFVNFLIIAFVLVVFWTILQDGQFILRK
jgi:hypothetical protein